jgi:quinol monooxygenase YgiN
MIINMSTIYLIAEIQATATKTERVIELLKELVAASRQEAGCLTYELFRDTTTDGLFIMREIWQSAQALEAHKQSDHFQNFVTTTEQEGTIQSLYVRPLRTVKL